MLKPRLTIKQAMNILNVNRDWLANTSGLSRNTIDRVMSTTQPHSINAATAQLIANALCCDVNEIDWPHSLSTLGRPPLTGVAIQQTTTITITKTAIVCPGCHYEIPSNGHCDNCE